MVLATPNDTGKDDGGVRFPFVGRFRNTPPAAPSHNNSQHVLAILSGGGSENHSFHNDTTEDLILQAFSKTSALPCDVWVNSNIEKACGNGNDENATTPSILLASNYPDCILESHNFCVLSAGFPYHYRDAFGNTATDSDSKKNDSHPPSPPHNPKSFARTVLDYCEALIDAKNRQTNENDIAEKVGLCLKKVSGHFSLFLVRKTKDGRLGGFWAWNDPFGFLPLYHHHHSSETIVLSSHWDCLVPAILDAPSQQQLQLDWDVVAEYLTLGTTLGGMPTKDDDAGSQTLDRTFVRGIENLRPGTCLVMEKENIHIRRYISCYGACEEIRLSKPKNHWKDAPTGEFQTKPAKSASNSSRSTANHRIRGVKLAEPNNKKYSHGENKKNLISPLPSSCLGEGNSNTNSKDNHHPTPSASSELLLSEMVHAISSCIEQAMAQGHVGRAALTGGGDTRLILACLLLLQEQQNDSIGSGIPEITFQTHSKQRTDWQIARHLASTFDLKHEHIRATATTLEGSYNLFQMLLLGSEEMLLSNLHDQTPLRRKQKKATDKHKESILSYTLHGRFGTEFLGCLCFDKSPLDIRQEEIEGFRPNANRWFEAIFESTASASSIQNPVDTLSKRFQELEEDKADLQEALSAASVVAPSSTPPFLGLDTAYAFQLQVYTRSCLSDIYKGLRGGSWFSIPTAQFSRNAITPFLDNTLLKLLLCHVSVQDKEEPYELYGKVYTSKDSNSSNKNSNGGVMDILRRIPSNNKLLCNHTGIPRAIKAPEATARPYLPKSINLSKRKKTHPGIRRAMEEVREHFHPVFWKGAIAIFERASVKMDPVSVGQLGCTDRDVGLLIERIGNPHDACLLSGRLQSFLLWHERRFLVHCHD